MGFQKNHSLVVWENAQTSCGDVVPWQARPSQQRRDVGMEPARSQLQFSFCQVRVCPRRALAGRWRQKLVFAVAQSLWLNSGWLLPHFQFLDWSAVQSAPDPPFSVFTPTNISAKSFSSSRTSASQLTTSTDNQTKWRASALPIAVATRE